MIPTCHLSWPHGGHRRLRPAPSSRRRRLFPVLRTALTWACGPTVLTARRPCPPLPLPTWSASHFCSFFPFHFLDFFKSYLGGGCLASRFAGSSCRFFAQFSLMCLPLLSMAFPLLLSRSFWWPCAPSLFAILISVFRLQHSSRRPMPLSRAVVSVVPGSSPWKAALP